MCAVQRGHCTNFALFLNDENEGALQGWNHELETSPREKKASKTLFILNFGAKFTEYTNFCYISCKFMF